MPKSTSLIFIAAQFEMNRWRATNGETMKKMTRILQNPKTICVAVLALGLLAQTQGYCTTEEDLKSLTTETTKIKDLLFGPVIRKIAVTLGFGAGLFQAFMSGSIRPLLIYGGLGLAVCFLPKVVELISNL